MATAFSLLLIPWLLLAGNRPLPRYGLTPLQVAAVYFIAGIAGGVVVAVAYPISRWFLGAFALGAIAAAPVYVGFGLLLRSSDDPPSLPWVLGGTLALFVGGGVGTQIWSEEHGGASRATVIALWVLVAASQPVGWYLGLHWAGESLAAVGLGFVFLPLYVALLAWVSRNRLGSNPAA
jgi:hypothetical protein